jgi:hypothetical protein
MALFGIIIEQNDCKEAMRNRFANFAGEKRPEFFGSPMKITTK